MTGAVPGPDQRIGSASGSAGPTAGDGGSAGRSGSGDSAARSKPTIAQLGIDLMALNWRRSGSGAGSFEVAFVAGAASNPLTETVGHPTGATAEWVLLRVAGDPAARVLIYDRVEWESFVDGAARGEFDDAAALGLVSVAHLPLASRCPRAPR